jgi:hypothetical protein
MKLDPAAGGFGRKIRRRIAKSQSHLDLLCARVERDCR